MSGRSPVPRTRFARVVCGEPGVTVLRISGSLGPRAKPQLVRLTQECLRRNLPRLVLDLSEVDALGGGTARLLNEFAAERAGRGGKTAFRVTSRTVRGFLCADRNLPPPPLAASLEEAVAAVRASGAPGRPEPVPARAEGNGSRPAGSAEARRANGESEPPAFGRPSEKPTLSSLFAPEDGGSIDWPDPTPSGETGRRHPEPDVFDLDLRDVVDVPGSTANRFGRLNSPEGLRERLVTTLHERQVASRVFLFQRHPDRRYYLVTRQGVDRERGFDSEGKLASSLHALHGPGFLVDIDPDGLSESEAELLGELNCEVTAPLGNGERPDYLLFLSKESPGDEYSIEELQELEEILKAAATNLPRREAELRSGSRETKPRGGPSPIEAKIPSPSVAQTLWAVGELPLSAEGLWDDEWSAASSAGAPSAGAPAPVSASVRAHRPVPDGASATPARGALPGAPAAHDFVFQEPERPAPIRVDDSSRAGNRRPPGADATRELRRTLAQMRDILSLSQDFDAAFGTSKLLEVLVLSVVSVARVETVLYFAAREGDYRLTHQRGMSPDAVQGLRLRGDATIVQRALASQRGVCIEDDAQINEEERIWARQHDLHYTVPFRFKDEIVGLLLLGDGTEDAPPDLDMLAQLLAQAGLAYDRARLYETLQDRTLGVVRGLITLIESRNGFDCGSTEQVVRYTQALARELQVPADGVRDLIYGAVLRDVGMLQVSESLLRAPTDLTGDQWESIRRHPQEGASIMRQMRFSPVAVDVVLHHHESYNGEGYPMGLRGRAIPLGARIVAVAESYVKMTMDRPYRKALGKAEALESLAENWGLRYDPLVVDALVRVVNRELSMGLKGDRDLTRDLFGV